MPLGRPNVTHVQSSAPSSDCHRSRKSVHQQIVPLIEDSDSPIARRQAREREGAVVVALGEREVFAVRIAKAHIALGPVVGVVRSTAVEPLIRRAAQPLAGDFARNRVVAGVRHAGLRAVGVCAAANVGQAGIDDRRVGETDAHMV